MIAAAITTIRPIMLRLLLLCLMILLAGCAQPGGSYYPLEPGMKWHYQVQQPSLPKKGITLEIENLANEQHEGQQYALRHSDSGHDYLFSSDEWGIYRAGWRPATDTMVQWEEVRRYVLPYPISPGQHWRQNDTLGLLGGQERVDMDYTATGLQETLWVPAGVFQGCLQVQGLGQLRSPNYSQPLNIRSQAWYAPGVGLIRLERTIEHQQQILDHLEVKLLEFHAPAKVDSSPALVHK